jgi:2,6-dihydroxypseudooxynicotine hydrolase
MTDERVRVATKNWAPRLVAQGIDHNDFVRTTKDLESWEQWLPAWRDTAAIHERLASDAAGRGAHLTAGEAFVRAALCYHFAKFLWLEDLELHRRTTSDAARCIYAAHEHLDPSAERVEFDSPAGPLVGNLRRSSDDDAPLVVLLPGLDSAKEEFFWWEEVFLRRGMSTFSLDGPGQGESGAHSKIRPDYEIGLAAALDALEDRVPTEGVGVAGVSLGGYYAARVAAMEQRVVAAAAIGGPYNFGALWDALPGLTRAAFTLHSGASSDDEGRANALQLDLAPVARDIATPLLVIGGGRDRLIPAADAERLGSEAPGAELVIYPEGNHVCNNIPYKYRPLVGDWLRERLAG